MSRPLPKHKRQKSALDLPWFAGRLKTGRSFSPGAPLLRRDRTAGGTTEAEYAEAWGLLRDQIMPAWLLKHPGTRPAGWWTFDAPEPRRRLLSGKDIFDNPKVTCPAAKRLMFGVTVCETEREWKDRATWETQEAYLRRHGLLTPAEEESLAEQPVNTAG